MDSWAREVTEKPVRYTAAGKCPNCGECRPERDGYALTTRDIYNVAGALNISAEEVIRDHCAVSTGGESCIPVVKLRPRGNEKACPLFWDKQCVLRGKPSSSCALLPHGRIKTHRTERVQAIPGNANTAYGFRRICHSLDISKGMRKNGAPTQDAFLSLWSAEVFLLSDYFKDRADEKTPEEFIRLLRAVVFAALYLNYDAGEELIPQFRANTSMLNDILKAAKTGSLYKKMIEEAAAGERGRCSSADTECGL